ncbi:alpha-amylase family glycosyl hydrolase [Psychrilyobacter atlanticus]|uniref:alpha-amylase family glycosyl hydrolase n=1 Tax=Psychrilyobacter atlanticus TaxID=271091 RepID=UPI000427E889|nr:alpha-amylase family glycosyl hydrolase [Psychrilyobacter atlanticus]
MNKDLIIYEIFPKCISEKKEGKLIDVINRLPYLSELGINTIWITPIFKSPQKDSGYDVSNYYKIDPIHGDEEILKVLIEKAHSLNIKIILDFVPNHTSNLHEWFIKSENKDLFYKDFYIWRDPRDGKEPNNWISKKNTGSVWEYSKKRKQYYLHLYSKEQPDLNWQNEGVRKEIYSAMGHWLDIGIDGFRLDVVNKLSKVNLDKDTDHAEIYYQNMPDTFEYIKEMREYFSKKYRRNIILIGQAEGIDFKLGEKYQENLDLVLEFANNHMGRGKNYRTLKSNFEEIIKVYLQWQQNQEYWPTLFWGSHDLPRAASRYMLDDDGENTGKIIGVFTLIGRGTPIIYNGDECGTLNCNFNSIEKYKDVRSQNIYNLRSQAENKNKVFSDIRAWSRDNARQLIDWENNLQVSKFYKSCIEIRKEYNDVISFGKLEYETCKDMIIYTIKKNDKYIKVTFNNSNKNKKIDLTNILLRTKNNDGENIASYEAIIEGNL